MRSCRWSFMCGFLGNKIVFAYSISFFAQVVPFPKKLKNFSRTTLYLSNPTRENKSPRQMSWTFVWLPEWGDALRKQSRRLFLASEFRERQAGSNLLRPESDKTLNRGFKSYNDNKKCHTFVWHFGSPSRIWTYDLVINSHLLHRWAIGEYI